MNRLEIVKRVKTNVFDENNDTFTNEVIIDYINEGIDRIKQSVIQLSGMVHLNTDEDIPFLLPSEYHHLIAVYSSARCFAQDERYYQGTTFMNEFEVKLDGMKVQIESGEIELPIDPDNPNSSSYEAEYVIDNYFTKRNGVI